LKKNLQDVFIAVTTPSTEWLPGYEFGAAVVHFSIGNNQEWGDGVLHDL